MKNSGEWGFETYLVMSPKRELRSSFPPKKQNMTKLFDSVEYLDVKMNE